MSATLSATPTAVWFTGILFGGIALWSCWAVTTAVQNHRRRKSYRRTRPIRARSA